MDTPKPSLLDGFQTLKGAYDDETSEFRVKLQQLLINDDGSINVKFLNNFGELKNFYNEVNSIASNSISQLFTYIVPENKQVLVYNATVSGTNIATYDIRINDTVCMKQRTWFGLGLNCNFKINLLLQQNDILNINVIHNRPFLGDFNTNVQLIEI